MKSFVQDLFGHQEWADAEFWKAVEACPGALDQMERATEGRMASD